MTPQTAFKDNALTTELSEIFSSLQGEGPYLGKKHIFVRFGRCNMHCGYCDEVEKMKQGQFRETALHEILAAIDRLEASEGAHHAVSLTGGEPLFYPKFLAQALPAIQSHGLLTYLETNGTLPEALKACLPWTDIVAMDIKPPSSTGDRAFWGKHAEFLRIAAAKEVFVKVVVTAATTPAEIEASAGLVADVSPQIPFIFQPESEMTGISLHALTKIREEFVGLASAKLKDVRVIPQMHKIWNIR